MDENFNLEKRKIHERLERVEAYMQDAKRLREDLIKEFRVLVGKVDGLHKTVFGFEKEVGMYQDLKDISILIKSVRAWLSRIFWLAVCYLVVASIPAVSSFFYNITHIK